MTSLPIEEFRKRILQRYAAKGKKKKTITQIEQVLRELVAVNVHETADITDEAIERWLLAWPTRTPVTFKSHLRCLSALCTIMRKKDWIDVDPFVDEPVSAWMRDDSRPAPPRRRYSKSPDDVRRIFALAKQEAESGSWEAWRRYALFATNHLTGARIGELLRLETHDVDRAAKTITIRAKWVTNSKGVRVWWSPKTRGSAGVIPIGDQLLEILLLWSVRRRRPYGRIYRSCTWLFPGKTLRGPWVTGGPGESPLEQIRALGERAGVRGLTNKAGRKGLGTYKEIGLTPMERREFFRHSDDATGDFYDDEKVESMRPAAAKIERFFLFGTSP